MPQATKNMEGKMSKSAKSRSNPPVRSQALVARPARPRGMQAMGPALYEQLRQAVRELDQQLRNR